ncbi:phosphotransferase [Streptomyces sp. NPDC048269]|uniref:phosphotransferase n=1 Tax=Streptomyces sp. NPDC048269 TaxID=3155753 RepID=UPI00344A1309
MNFTKRYQSTEAARTAAAHHSWLQRTGLPVPALTGRHGQVLAFQHLPGRHAAPSDLPAIARVLGAAHAHAYRTELQRARLDRTLLLPDGTRLAAFTEGRVDRVQRLLNEGRVPGATLTAGQAAELIGSASDEPASYYKDSNPRNFMVTATSVTAVDFDDLTLAPFGYDLAKLIATTAMTHGKLPAPLVADALSAYNRSVPHPCTSARLTQWAEIHHVLTSPYLGRNAYAHSWHTLRPDERTP